MGHLNKLKTLVLGSLLTLSSCVPAHADTPPQVINKLCSANQFFSQIQPGPNNINCTQPTYSGIANTPTFADSVLISSNIVTLLNDVLNPGNSKFYGTNSSGVRGWYTVSTDVNTIGTIDSGTPSANGASISGNSLLLQSASTSNPGLVNNSSQSFSGNKTFTGTIAASNFSGTSSGTNTGDVTIGTANGLSLSSQILSLGTSSALTTGALTSADYIDFAAKQDALSFTAPLVNTTDTITCNVASGSQPGCLSSSDWTTFNSKQAAGNYITALSSDVVATGPGAVVATIQTNVVSNSKLAQMGAHTLKANNTGSTANASDVAIGTVTESTSSVLTLTGWSNATIGSPTIQVLQSGASQSGYLSTTDWNTFNNKQASLTFGNLTDVGTDGLVVTGGTGAVIGSGTSLAQHVSDSTHNGYLTSTDWSTFNGKQAALSFTAPLVNTTSTITCNAASASQPGCLSSTDWSTFNGKQSAGNYLTALTGDGTAAGPGSSALTLATVNSNVGSFGSASSVGAFTVNAKGLVTAASSTSIQIAESQVTNLVSDLAGKQATGNYITALTGDVTASGPGSAVATLASSISGAKTFSTSLTSPAFISSTASVATAGAIRLANADVIDFKNAGGSGNLAFGAGSADAIPQYNSIDLVNLSTAQTLTNKSLSGSSNTFTSIPNSATTATNANTNSAIVARDGSGNFSAGTITASLTGHASLDLALTGGTLSGALNGTSGSFSGVVTTTGVTDGSNATAGKVGEYLESVVTSFTNFGTSGTYFDATSLSLTAGDWLITAIIVTATSGTITGDMRMAITTTSGNSSTGIVLGNNAIDLAIATSGFDSSGSVPSYRQSISSTTIYYLKFNATYSVATPQYTCRLSAVRIR